ncbi:MAG TPA: DNA helicase PriA [Bacilli bacterium]|nr:DNA helicase PriA [Bacilli bacterium]
MEEVNKKNNRALDNKCPACHAPILFNPKLGKWKCDYCNSEFSLDEMKKYNNASSEVVNEGVTGDDTSYESYRCKDCGAEIIADENTAATFCVYCGNTAILKSKLSGKFAPTKIIPFKNVKEDAIAAFKHLKKGRPFLPSNFISEKNIEKITGLYIPFWLYDLMSEGQIEADCKKIKTWSVGNTHYTKTDTYKVTREGHMQYQKIPVDGSTRFENDIMNTIEPFDYNEMVDYNHAFLSGFLAEKYDVETDNAIKDAIDRADTSTVTEMKNSIIGYSTVNVSNKNINVKEEKHEYALLPVWMVNVKYNDKYYTFAMNGQTGEFVGNMPISKKKVFIYATAIFAICFIAIVLISYIAYVTGA